MKSAVIDTNVFVSALIGSRVCKEIYELLKFDRFDLVISDDLLAELGAVSRRANFELNNQEIDDLLWHIRAKARKIIPLEKVIVCRDPKDNIVLECVLSAKVDFLVTGDKDLLVLETFYDTRIITLRQFIARLKHR